MAAARDNPFTMTFILSPPRKRGSSREKFLDSRSPILVGDKFRGNDSSGFSVIEFVIAVAIFAVAGIAVITFQKDVFSLNRIISGNIELQDDARKALKAMSSEIRTASPSSIGSYPILQTATSSFSFYSDIDADPLKERVRYFLNDRTLRKGVVKATGTPLAYDPLDEVVTDLVHHVANTTTSIFSYYDSSYDGTTAPLAEPIDISAVRFVKIELILDRDPRNIPGPIMLTTQVTMRNLKDNL